MKIYMAKDGLHIEGIRAEIIAVSSACLDALDNGKVTHILPIPTPTGVMVLHVEVQDVPERDA